MSLNIQFISILIVDRNILFTFRHNTGKRFTKILKSIFPHPCCVTLNRTRRLKVKSIQPFNVREKRRLAVTLCFRQSSRDPRLWCTFFSLFPRHLCGRG